MADMPPLGAVPDPDDQSSVDPDDLAFVVAQLAALDYLRPDDAPLGTPTTHADPMPSDAWDRLQAVLRAQAPAAAAARGSRTARWAGGLVAAGVAVVAIGIAATVLRSGGAAVVADSAADQAAGQSAKMLAPSASAFAAAEAAVPADAAAVDPVPAARAVMDSRTDYRPDALPGQVVSLVKQAGFATLRDAVDKRVPAPTMPVDDGFTSSWDELRHCITWLTHSDDTQALVVDRGTYSGVEAGVVVAPAVLDTTVATAPATGPAGGSASPLPTATLDTPDGMFDVWVVDPQCEQVAASLDDFAVYEWRQ